VDLFLVEQSLVVVEGLPLKALRDLRERKDLLV
jgi:hypothetical protein